MGVDDKDNHENINNNYNTRINKDIERPQEARTATWQLLRIGYSPNSPSHPYIHLTSNKPSK